MKEKILNFLSGKIFMSILGIFMILVLPFSWKSFISSIGVVSFLILAMNVFSAIWCFYSVVKMFSQKKDTQQQKW